MLQAKVKEEHKRLDHLFNEFPVRKLSGTYPYSAAKLRKLHRRSSAFAPAFVCPLCREPIKVTPVECLPLRDLGAAVKELTPPQQEREGGSSATAFPCDLSDYFIFPQSKSHIL